MHLAGRQPPEVIWITARVGNEFGTNEKCARPGSVGESRMPPRGSPLTLATALDSVLSQSTDSIDLELVDGAFPDRIQVNLRFTVT